MTNSKALTLGGFVLLGAVVVWQFVRINEMQEANAVFRNSTASGADHVPAHSGENAETTATRPVSLPETGSGKPPDTDRQTHFRKRREMDRKQRHDAKILALTTKLKLTAEQQAAIRAALEKGSAERDAVREAGEARRRESTGNVEDMRRAGMAKIAEVDANQEKEIAATLSADQLAAYSEYQTEQNRTSIENRANQQLGDLLTRFSLTEDQKEAAFQFFAKQEEENGLEPARVAAMGGDFVKLFEERQKEQLEGLKQILTPEQYELYKTQQEQRAATFRNLVPGEFRPGRP